MELIEGDIFRIIIPLDSEYSFDYEIGKETTQETTQKTTQKTIDILPIKLTLTEKRILGAIYEDPHITQKELATHIGITLDGIRYAIKNLKKKGILGRSGSRKNGIWTINCK